MLGDMLVTLENAVEAAADCDVPPSLAALSDDELLASLARHGAVLAAAQTLVAAHAAEVAARSARERGRAGLARRRGFRSPSGLVAAVAGLHGAAAHQLRKVGEAIAPRESLTGEDLPARFPHLARQVTAGRVTTDTAALIVTRLGTTEGRAKPELWCEAEEKLADLAVGADPDAIRPALDAWIAAVDPDGVEPREAEARAREFLVIGERPDAHGLVALRGRLGPRAAGTLLTAFDALTHPRHDTARHAPADRQEGDTGDASDDAASPAAAAGADLRSRAQRMVDALVEVCTRAMAAGLPGTGGTPTQVCVLTEWSRLRDSSGIGHVLGGTGPVSNRTVRELACEADVCSTILGPGGVVLDLGTTRRKFSRPQRLALAVRDGGCIWPGCDRPPDWADAHHVRHWADGGPTDVDNGVLLCAFHHHLLHDGEHGVIEMRPTAFGPAVPYIRLPRWIDPTETWTRARSRRAAWQESTPG